MLASDEAHTNTTTSSSTLLIDQHGTGRMLFRNTRVRLSAGFPQRHFMPSVLNDDSNETRMSWLSAKLKELWRRTKSY